MRRNPLLYSDQTEVEEINTIEPIQEKRSFMFYFIVLANTLLVLLVLLVIWSLFSKPSNTSFDQQLKTWTQQFFNPVESSNAAIEQTPTIIPTPVETQQQQDAIAKAKELEALRLEEERIAKELAVKAEQERLAALAAKLAEEKAKAEAIQKAVDEAKVAETETIEENKEVVEPAVVPNAAQSIPEQPNNNAKTQLEQILETMQNQ